MTYNSRIPASSEYLQSVGRAFHNFTYLERVVVWTIVKLSADGFDSAPRGQTASVIAKALIRAIDGTLPPLSVTLRAQLVRFHGQYVEAIRKRNKLLHAHPYTSRDGQQQLQGGGVEWPITTVDEAAQFFETAALDGNGVFHGELAQVRP